MHAFEVTVPPLEDAAGSALRMVIHAPHWMDAWKQALLELGEPASGDAQVTCKIGSDGSVEVVALGSGRRVLVRSLEEQVGLEEEAPRPRERPAPRRGELLTTIQDRRPATSERPKIRKMPRRQRSVLDDPVAVVPYVRPVSGGPETSTAEALDMLRRHVACDAVLFLLPESDGKGWRVDIARGGEHDGLVGELLRPKERIPGPVDGGPGRLTFAGEGVAVRFVRSFARRSTVRVKSALWAPVKDGYRVLGLLLLLNARRGAGFTDGELSAVRELADLVAARFSESGA